MPGIVHSMLKLSVWIWQLLDIYVGSFAELPVSWTGWSLVPCVSAQELVVYDMTVLIVWTSQYPVDNCRIFFSFIFQYASNDPFVSYVKFSWFFLNKVCAKCSIEFIWCKKGNQNENNSWAEKHWNLIGMQVQSKVLQSTQKFQI